MSNSVRNFTARSALLKQAVAALLVLAGGQAMAANVNVDLCATAGAIPLSAKSGLGGQAILGYTASAVCTVDTTVAAPVGPTLVAHVGDTVNVTLRSSLAEATGLLFQGQSLIPDTVGLAVGTGNKPYTFTAGAPGTYLYEAAPLLGKEHQSAMGLHGALVILPAQVAASASGTSTVDESAATVLTDSTAAFTQAMKGGTLTTPGGTCTIATVTPTTLTCAAPIAAGWLLGDAYSVAYNVEANTAYTDATADTAFTSDAVLVLSELDPALNAAGAGFDMRDFAPKYFLINGQAYPDTASITSAAGGKLLLRYVNAGAKHHSMSLLGLRQRVVGRDGNLLPTSGVALTAETIAPGQTADAIATLPATLAAASNFAVFDAALQLHNNGTAGFGGMLTFVSADAGAAASGPVARNVQVAPTTSTGKSAVALSAAITGATSAEYFVDASGAAGTGCPMAVTPAAANASIGVSGATALCTDLTLLATGKHTFYVHGTDGTTWGAFGSATLSLDKSGPAISGVVLNPNPTTGLVDITLTATANDTANGGSNVASAEYQVGSGAPKALALNTTAAPVSALSGTIAASELLPSGLSSYQIGLRSTDALGNTGAWVTATLTISGTGPITSAVTAAPNPNNGAKPLSTAQPVVRVRASMTSSPSTTVVAAEGFIDTATPPLTTRGFPLIATDGQWNAATEAGYADIPLTTIATLGNGDHYFYVRGKDAVGNWGNVAQGTLTIDRAPPVVTAASVQIALATPLAPSGSTSTQAATNNFPVTVTAAGTDLACTGGVCTVAGGEYFIDVLGAAGTGTPMALTATAGQFRATVGGNVLQGLSAGMHRIYVRALDAAGNYSTGTAATTPSATLLIDRTLPTFGGITLAPQTGGVSLGIVNAVDPVTAGLASGLAQGQYVVNSTNFPNSGGAVRLFALPGTNPLIPIGGNNNLVANCVNSVSVRIRDAATNWSNAGNANGGVRTAFVTVGTPNPLIFANGFDSGTGNWGWTSKSTNTSSRLDVQAAAAQAGARGLQAQGNNTNYVQYNFPGAGSCPTATPIVDARFYFNPRNYATTGHTIFSGRSGTNNGANDVFTVQYRRTGGGGGAQSQVRIQLGNNSSTWFTIPGNTYSSLEVTWQAAGSSGNAAGQLALYVNGAATPTRTLSATGNASTVSSVRLGSVTDGGNSAALEYFDSVLIQRTATPLIGP